MRDSLAEFGFYGWTYIIFNWILSLQQIDSYIVKLKINLILLLR